MKIITLKSSKSLTISVLWVAPLGGLTCSHHSNQVFPHQESGYPTLESCYPTSEGPSTSVSVLPHR